MSDDKRAVSPFRMAWLTDVHLDHVDRPHHGPRGETREMVPQAIADAFATSVAGADAVVVTGDVSVATRLRDHLRMMATRAAAPLYYVLGNHDYYGGTIPGVRHDLREDDPACWLGRGGVVRLTEQSALVGHDGWYDGGYGDWFASTIMMNDYVRIRDFVGLRPKALYRAIDDLAHASARDVADRACAAISAGYRKVYVATHVPPFALASRAPNGSPSDRDWLPVMSSKRMGDALLELARAHREIAFEVLCGHTHTRCVLRAAPNLVCRVGEAAYGTPWGSLQWIEVP